MANSNLGAVVHSSDGCIGGELAADHDHLVPTSTSSRSRRAGERFVAVSYFNGIDHAQHSTGDRW